MIYASAEDEFRLYERVHECAGNSSLWADTIRCAQRTFSCLVRLIEVRRNGEHTGRYCSFDDASPILDFLRGMRTEANKTALCFLLNDAAINYPYCKIGLADGSFNGFPWNQEEEPEIASWPGLIAPVLRTDEVTILLVCLWSSVAIEDATPDAVMGPFRRLAKAASLALSFAAEKAAAEERNHALELMMSHQSDALCLADANFAVHFMTPSYQEILSDGNIFTVSENRLVPVRRDLEAAFNSVSRHIAETADLENGAAASGSNASPEQSLLIVDNANGLCRVLIRGLASDESRSTSGSGGYILVKVKKPTQLSDEVLVLLQSAFGLSKSEARLALDLATSGSLGDTLENLQITRNTAKTHLRRIYEKTSTQSQVELIQLLQSLNGLF